MKRVGAVIVLLFITVLFGGCAPKTENKAILYPWPVILAIKYQLTTEPTADSLEMLGTYLTDITNGFEVRAGISQSGKDLQIEFYFDTYDVNDKDNIKNHKEFLRFMGLDHDDNDLSKVQCKYQEKLFYIENTYTFTNPWKTIEDDMQCVEGINFEVRSRFALQPGSEPQYYYVFNTGFRRSKVTGAYKKENLVIEYNYYFRGSGEDYPTQIVVFDKFANQTAWYFTAFLATGVFMGVIYAVLRYSEKARQKPEIIVQ
ncbi:MAG: hypothetical protein LBG88_01100 [Christensenellaceae bacterium]|jgi:hypothetical protein|nr:hypothetical protein [Christensenellaceae bacterium]